MIIAADDAVSELSAGRSTSRRLSFQDIAETAGQLGLEPALLQALVTVETGSMGGYLPDGRLTLLFEAHHFGRLTKHRWSDTHPQLSTRTWRRLYASTRNGEWQRFLAAAALDAAAAIQSCSWGLFQILGSNYSLCGSPSPAAFVLDLHKGGEPAHLQAVAAFLKARDLIEPLRHRDWHSFARAYNGPGYRANAYDRKLAAAYYDARDGILPRNVLSIGARGDAVRDLQRALNRLLDKNLAVDGIFGPLTQAAVEDLQERLGLTVDGVVGSETRRALNNALYKSQGNI